jgi:hypothetical protein
LFVQQADVLAVPDSESGEVGPGPGDLGVALLQRGFELDRPLSKALDVGVLGPAGSDEHHRLK